MAKERQLSQEVKEKPAKAQRFRRIAPRAHRALQAALTRQEQDKWSAASLQ
jgi:hypothetical protein